MFRLIWLFFNKFVLFKMMHVRFQLRLDFQDVVLRLVDQAPNEDEFFETDREKSFFWFNFQSRLFKSGYCFGQLVVKWFWSKHKMDRRKKQTYFGNF